MKEITENAKELLTAVMNEYKSSVMMDLEENSINEEQYYVASENCVDLMHIFRVLEELYNNGDVLNHLDEDVYESWVYARDTFTEFYNWKETIEKLANENGSSPDTLAEVITLFQYE